MYYIAYIGVSLIIVHFILYYFNIDIFNYSNKLININNDDDNDDYNDDDNDITDSINELKKINEYIDNGKGEKTICENGKR